MFPARRPRLEENLPAWGTDPAGMPHRLSERRLRAGETLVTLVVDESVDQLRSGTPVPPGDRSQRPGASDIQRDA